MSRRNYSGLSRRVFLPVWCISDGVSFGKRHLCAGCSAEESICPAGIGLAAALLLAALAVRFVVALTIFATSVWGGIVAGTSVYQLVPVQRQTDKYSFLRNSVCCGWHSGTAFAGVQEKENAESLEKAAEIRETHSTENEVEKARSLIADLDTVPGGDSGEAEEQDIEIIDLGVGDEEEEE